MSARSGDSEPRGWRRLSSLEAAARNRCPVCGQGALTRGMLTPHDHCSVCRTDFTRHAAGDGAVYIVLTICCAAVMGLVVWLELSFQPPAWATVLVGTAATLALTYGLLPVTKRFMVAQSIVMDAGPPTLGPDPDAPDRGASNAQERPGGDGA